MSSCCHKKGTVCSCRTGSQTIGIPKQKKCGGCSGSGARSLAPAGPVVAKVPMPNSPAFKVNKSHTAQGSDLNSNFADAGTSIQKMIDAGAIEHPEAAQRALRVAPVNGLAQVSDDENSTPSGNPQTGSVMDEPAAISYAPLTYFRDTYGQLCYSTPDGRQQYLPPDTPQRTPPMQGGHGPPIQPFTFGQFDGPAPIAPFIPALPRYSQQMGQPSAYPMTPSTSHGSNNSSIRDGNNVQLSLALGQFQGYVQPNPFISNHTGPSQAFANSFMHSAAAFVQQQLPQQIHHLSHTMVQESRTLDSGFGVQSHSNGFSGHQYPLPPDFGSLDHPLHFEQWKRSNHSSLVSHSAPPKSTLALLDADIEPPYHLRPELDPALLQQRSESEHGSVSETKIISSANPTLLHTCTCGDSCECLGCAAHPFNATTQQYAKDIYLQASEATPTSSTPSASKRVSCCDSIRSPVDMHSDPSSTEASPDAGNSEQEFHPENYLWVEYSVGAGCGGDAESCPCGDDCACIACAIHKPWTVPGYTGSLGEVDAATAFNVSDANSGMPDVRADGDHNAVSNGGPIEVSSCCSGKTPFSAPEKEVNEDKDFLEDFIYVNAADSTVSSESNQKWESTGNDTPKPVIQGCCRR